VQKSYELELLDGDNYTKEELYQNLKELNTINTYLGGHAITINGIKKLLKNTTLNKPIIIAEMGCGGGDNLQAIAKFLSKNNIPFKAIGVDKLPACITYANKNNSYPNAINYVLADYTILQNEEIDILFNSLFCHHFTDESLISMLQWMKANSKIGFFINDLHRHSLAAFSIKVLTQLFSKSRLVKNDAVLSVKRGFLKTEWQAMAAKAACNLSVQWQWAFRHLVVYKHAK
jgi:SAM-dependent methyltransferase